MELSYSLDEAKVVFVASHLLALAALRLSNGKGAAVIKYLVILNLAYVVIATTFLEPTVRMRNTLYVTTVSVVAISALYLAPDRPAIWATKKKT